MSAKIATALHDVMAKCGYVQKSGKNTFHGYKYAGEADLLEKLRPAMVEAGLLLIPSIKHVSDVDQHGNVNVIVEYTLAHKDGDVWPEKVIGVGCGNDMSPKTGRVGDKGVYKAITGANKYVLFKLFQIETGDDPEKDDVDAAPRNQPIRRPPSPPPAPRDDNQDLYDSFQRALADCGDVETMRLCAEEYGVTTADPVIAAMVKAKMRELNGSHR